MTKDKGPALLALSPEVGVGRDRGVERESPVKGCNMHYSQ